MLSYKYTKTLAKGCLVSFKYTNKPPEAKISILEPRRPIYCFLLEGKNFLHKHNCMNHRSIILWSFFNVVLAKKRSIVRNYRLFFR